MTRFSAPLPAEVITLPDLLRKQGYYTGLVGRSHHLDGSPVPGPIAEAYQRERLATMASRVDMENKIGDRTKAARFLREFLDQAKDKPFYLQLCFSDPHRPHDAGENRSPDSLKLPGHYPDLPEVRADLARYYAEVERLDGNVGQLLDILEERGLTKNTLVVFMGDNGASQLRGKGTLYEFGLHVPLIIRWPGVVKPGTASDTLVSGEDMTPTLLTAAGVEPLKSMTGVSFLPALRGESFEGRKEVFAERGAHGSGLPTNTGAFDLSRCIITRRHKLIYNALPKLAYSPVDFSGGRGWTDVVKANAAGQLPPELSAVYFPKERPMFELYDLESDPWELHNLAGSTENASLEKDLIERLSLWMLHERDYLPLPIGPAAVKRK
jgi:arylsulfatase A-like enzyme